MIALAMIIDAIFGEPRWLWSRIPHPAALFGRGIALADKRFNTGQNGAVRGAALMAVMVGVAIGFGVLVQYISALAAVLIAAILIAQKSLVDHVADVAAALRMDLNAGRKSVAMIVGRDTKDMTAPQVARAAIESAAENFSDGVVAPIFWFAVAGLPGILVYKVINTADSMIGYRTPKYERFGKAAARLDDVLNLVPARLTAGMILFTHGQITQLWTLRGDARLHRSPNAGWPEAAIARVLNIALSGPRSYHGQVTDFPWVNAAGRTEIGPKDIDASIRVLWRAWALLLVLAVAISLLKFAL
ncbi:MAG: adenosylcobinamide-phosphate synthase CbiB [Planktomarina sp.]